MTSQRGYTLIELMVVLGIIGVLSAAAIPVYIESSARNALWTASETIGSQIRQARLKAITKNRSFRVRFDCPALGQFRILEVTGNALIDDAADRCSNSQQFDSGVFQMPATASFGPAVDTLTVSARGIYTSDGAIPQTITVTYGAISRTLTVSATGQITFSTF